MNPALHFPGPGLCHRVQSEAVPPGSLFPRPPGVRPGPLGSSVGRLAQASPAARSLGGVPCRLQGPKPAGLAHAGFLRGSLMARHCHRPGCSPVMRGRHHSWLSAAGSPPPGTGLLELPGTGCRLRVCVGMLGSRPRRRLAAPRANKGSPWLPCQTPAHLWVGSPLPAQWGGPMQRWEGPPLSPHYSGSPLETQQGGSSPAQRLWQDPEVRAWLRTCSSGPFVEQWGAQCVGVFRKANTDGRTWCIESLSEDL